MSALSRRSFLRLAGASAASTAAVATAAPEMEGPASEMVGVLIDTTRCVGCRACEAACTEKNRQPPPDACGDREVFDKPRELATDRFTVVDRAPSSGGDAPARYVKRQCLHCVEPACASACPTRALEKRPEGPVVYHAERCMGCRYCMVACPFEVPRFEYDSPTPYIKKCELCFDLQDQGKQPACVAVCPTGALTFGRRARLLDEAKTRIYRSDRYVRHVYGEREAGGTCVLYIADVPFERLGLKTTVGETGYPELTRGALGSVPFVITLWPPLLMGIRAFMRARDRKEARHE